MSKLGYIRIHFRILGPIHILDRASQQYIKHITFLVFYDLKNEASLDGETFYALDFTQQPLFDGKG